MVNGKIGCVEIRAWLPEKDGIQNDGDISFGHVALRTYYVDSNRKFIEKGIYVSFWPKSNLSANPKSEAICPDKIQCDRHLDHFHGKDQDDLRYRREPPAKNIIKLYTLDIEKIQQEYLEFKANPNRSWGIFGSFMPFEKNTTKTCSGLCLYLLLTGEFFTNLGYANNKNCYKYSAKTYNNKFFAAASVPLTLILWIFGLLGIVYPIVNALYTPREVLEFAKKLEEIETVLFSNDIAKIEKKLENEILRLRNTKTAAFFTDSSAVNKAIHLEAALLRAKNASELKTVADFLFYSYQGMDSIIDAANVLRGSYVAKQLTGTTTTFKNLFSSENQEFVREMPKILEDEDPIEVRWFSDEDENYGNNQSSQTQQFSSSTLTNQKSSQDSLTSFENNSEEILTEVNTVVFHYR